MFGVSSINHRESNPLSVSVITVVFNGKQSLEKTINSVLNQTYTKIEYIVIDGGSTDGTLDMIEKYQSAIDFTVSEYDSGIADAMNKGLDIATGDYIIYMNCGDYFLNKDSLSAAMIEIDDNEILMCKILFGSNHNVLYPRGFNFWMNFKTGVLHQGAIVRREVFDKIGGFDLQFKIALDYDFFLRAYLNNIKAKKSEQILSFMDDFGVSSKNDKASLMLRLGEEREIHKKNCNSIFIIIIQKIYWKIYPLYKIAINRDHG